MASHMAYFPFVSSPVARKRYTSPTTATVRPSAGVRRVRGWGIIESPYFSLCFLKNSHIRSFAEMFLTDFPMKPTGGCWPGQV